MCKWIMIKRYDFFDRFGNSFETIAFFPIPYFCFENPIFMDVLFLFICPFCYLQTGKMDTNTFPVIFLLSSSPWKKDQQNARRKYSNIWTTLFSVFRNHSEFEKITESVKKQYRLNSLGDAFGLEQNLKLEQKIGGNLVLKLEQKLERGRENYVAELNIRKRTKFYSSFFHWIFNFFTIRDVDWD